MPRGGRRKGNGHPVEWPSEWIEANGLAFALPVNEIAKRGG